jgi:hypothetical protein
MALCKRGFLPNHSGDFPQVILIPPSHVPNTNFSSYFYVRIVQKHFLRAMRGLLEAMRVLLEAVKGLLEAVRMFVKSVRAHVKA